MRPPCLLPVYFLFTVFEKQAIDDESFAKILFTFCLLLVYFYSCNSLKTNKMQNQNLRKILTKKKIPTFFGIKVRKMFRSMKRSLIFVSEDRFLPPRHYIGRPVRCKCLISIPRSCLAYGHRNNEWFLTVPCRTLSFPFPEISL